VVGVVVREHDPAGAAAPPGLLDERRGVRGEVRAGVDDPARIAPDDVAVGPRQRERAGVVGPDERDVLRGERIFGHPAKPTPLGGRLD
jgi:hypothetical protein